MIDATTPSPFLFDRLHFPELKRMSEREIKARVKDVCEFCMYRHQLDKQDEKASRTLPIIKVAPYIIALGSIGLILFGIGMSPIFNHAMVPMGGIDVNTVITIMGLAGAVFASVLIIYELYKKLVQSPKIPDNSEQHAHPIPNQESLKEICEARSDAVTAQVDEARQDLKRERIQRTKFKAFKKVQPIIEMPIVYTGENLKLESNERANNEPFKRVEPIRHSGNRGRSSGILRSNRGIRSP